MSVNYVAKFAFEIKPTWSAPICSTPFHLHFQWPGTHILVDVTTLGGTLQLFTCG
jgi:hypothetical protein